MASDRFNFEDVTPEALVEAVAAMLTSEAMSSDRKVDIDYEEIKKLADDDRPASLEVLLSAQGSLCRLEGMLKVAALVAFSLKHEEAAKEFRTKYNFTKNGIKMAREVLIRAIEDMYKNESDDDDDAPKQEGEKTYLDDDAQDKYIRDLNKMFGG